MSSDEASKSAEAIVRKYNFETFRMGQDYSSNSIAVKPVLTGITCRKPNRSEFFRTHPEFEFQTAILEDGDTREVYLVAPELWSELGTDLKKKIFVLCVNRNGKPFLWPLNVPDPDRSMAWTDSALAAANLAKSTWVRIKADMSAQMYEVVVAEGLSTPPQWPTLSQNEILELSFKKRIIESFDHPALKKLRGEL